MTICIRVDDYPGTKPNEFYRHNRESFEKFDDVLQEVTGKKYLLGVIPKHTSDEDLEWLGTRNLTVGQHGTDHDERFQNQFGERFTRHEIEVLLRPHRERLQRLTKQPVHVYLPPHNAIDPKTISALSASGFKAFTSGPGGMFDRSFIREDMMNCLHSSSPYEYGRSDELLDRKASDYLMFHAQVREVWLTLHFPWEVNLDNDFSTLRTFLKEIRRYVADCPF